MYVLYVFLLVLVTNRALSIGQSTAEQRIDRRFTEAQYQLIAEMQAVREQLHALEDDFEHQVLTVCYLRNRIVIRIQLHRPTIWNRSKNYVR
jgi:hypothetical protein